MNKKEIHELNINSYSLDEILDLFQLNYDFNITDLKQAKKRVLQLHPDKSRLAPEYFLFYKKAYEKIVELYEDIDRQNRNITKESTIYNTEVYTSNNRDTVINFDKNIQSQINKQSKSPSKFNKNFNELFEKNMMSVPNPQKNKWFSQENTDIENNPYKVPINGVSLGNIGKIMEEMKIKADATNSLIKRHIVKDHYNTNVGVSSLYENEDNNEYITNASLFGGLKFDDIRKVHKDETIIPVGTVKQIEKETTARAITIDDFISQRENMKDIPIAKDEAERILAEKQRRERAQIMEQQYKANLKTDEFNIKNSIVLANMIRIKNGK